MEEMGSNNINRGVVFGSKDEAIARNASSVQQVCHYSTVRFSVLTFLSLLSLVVSMIAAGFPVLVWGGGG